MKRKKVDIFQYFVASPLVSNTLLNLAGMLTVKLLRYCVVISSVKIFLMADSILERIETSCFFSSDFMKLDPATFNRILLRTIPRPVKIIKTLVVHKFFYHFWRMAWGLYLAESKRHRLFFMYNRPNLQRKCTQKELPWSNRPCYIRPISINHIKYRVLFQIIYINNTIWNNFTKKKWV